MEQSSSDDNKVGEAVDTAVYDLEEEEQEVEKEQEECEGICERWGYFLVTHSSSNSISPL